MKKEIGFKCGLRTMVNEDTHWFSILLCKRAVKAGRYSGDIYSDRHVRITELHLTKFEMILLVIMGLNGTVGVEGEEA